MTQRLSGGRGGRRAAKRQQQHLYLVFDDSTSGYSIRKIYFSSDSDSDDDDAAEPPHAVSGERAETRLPPAILRVQAPRGLPHYFVAAFGTRILAMHPGVPGTDGKLRSVHKDFVPCFDVCSRGIIFAPRPKPDPADPIYFPVGDRLFALGAGSFQQLYPPPLEHPGGNRWMWSWHELPKPPFETRHVTSYTVHPDGRTIFVSTEMRDAAATFTFDTLAPALEWKQHGEWALPFSGRAHFDTELDAWVGLSKDALGHVCSCDAVPPASSDTGDARKVGKENLFSEDPAETHVGATLLYMARRSRFCLVQCISIQDDCVDNDDGDDDDDDGNEDYTDDDDDEDEDDDNDEEEEKDVRRPCRHLLRLTTFSLNYNKHGDVTTAKSRRVQYYKVPKASTEFLLKSPVAFWL